MARTGSTRFKIRPLDLIKCVTPTRETSFSLETIKSAFSDTRVVPFTRSALFDVITSERATALMLEDAKTRSTIPCSMWPRSLLLKMMKKDSNIMKTIPIYSYTKAASAQQTCVLGPIASDKAYDVVKERHRIKNKMQQMLMHGERLQWHTQSPRSFRTWVDIYNEIKYS